jgi:ABC-type sugar transport system ATPase subunit
MVFQDCALCPECSVWENLYLGREIVSIWGFLAIRKMKDRARQMIAHYDLPIPDMDIKVRELSGGQQKAVAIGRALLSAPRLLILDEPTAALGVREQETVLRVIRELRSRGTGIIFCTHAPDEILSVAERILVLNRGRLAHDLKIAGMSRPQVQNLMGA